MKRFLPSIYFLLLTLPTFAQDQLWGSYFSYYNVVDIAQSNSRVYAAGESAMFSQNTLNGELKTITSVDGLRPNNITAICHSSAYSRTLVGDATGLLIVVNNDGSTVNKIDIVQETTIAASKKKINHILENDGIAYIATDYGISAFNIATLEFIDTYYLGPNGAEIAVLQTAVFNGNLYAVTAESGIRRGQLSNPNLNDFSQWETYNTAMWQTIAAFNETLFVTNGGAIFKLFDNGATEFFGSTPTTIVDMRVANNYLLATSAGKILAYTADLNLSFQINTVGEPATFSCSSIVGGKLYVGTTDKGVFAVDQTNFAIQNITPSGPLRNNIFAIEKSPNTLWAVFGGYSYYHQPDQRLYGASKLGPEGWISIPASAMLNARSISDITINPGNENEVYLNSYESGLLKVVDDVPVILYNDSNGLDHEQMDNTQSTRIIGGTFDRNGKLWVMNTRTKNALKSFNGNTWTPYSFEDILPPTKEQEYGIMAIDKNGTKWIPTYSSGLLAFNEALSNKYIVINTDSGLP
ncbi:MAG: ABC transporter substrate-binding protein, partial [Bacteroidota bacterium]